MPRFARGFYVHHFVRVVVVSVFALPPPSLIVQWLLSVLLQQVRQRMQQSLLLVTNDSSLEQHAQLPVLRTRMRQKCENTHHAADAATTTVTDCKRNTPRAIKTSIRRCQMAVTRTAHEHSHTENTTAQYCTTCHQLNAATACAFERTESLTALSCPLCPFSHSLLSRSELSVQPRLTCLC